MTLAVLTSLVLLVIAPHAAKLDHAAPALAIAVWFGVLMVRALVVVVAIAASIFYLPATQIFAVVTHWCWRTLIPQLSMQLGFDGHAFGALATFVPVTVVLLSLISAVYGLVRAMRAVRRYVGRARVGTGPHNSIVVGDTHVLLAVAGIAHPQVIVSKGALRRLDSEELAAGIEHEHGHIGRRHQRFLLLAELFRAVARFLPGTNRAMSELIFHTERDADEWALLHNHDCSVLASAICKAALSPTTDLAPALAGGQTARRVKLLLSERARHPASNGLAFTIATTLVVTTIVFVSSIPSVVGSTAASASIASIPYNC